MGIQVAPCCCGLKAIYFQSPGLRFWKQHRFQDNVSGTPSTSASAVRYVFGGSGAQAFFSRNMGCDGRSRQIYYTRFQPGTSNSPNIIARRDIGNGVAEEILATVPSPWSIQSIAVSRPNGKIGYLLTRAGPSRFGFATTALDGSGFALLKEIPLWETGDITYPGNTLQSNLLYHADSNKMIYARSYAHAGSISTSDYYAICTLDDSGTEDIIFQENRAGSSSAQNRRPGALAYHYVEQKIYYGTWDEIGSTNSGIYKLNLDGTNRELVLGRSTLDRINTVQIDAHENVLYYSYRPNTSPTTANTGIYAMACDDTATNELLISSAKLYTKAMSQEPMLVGEGYFSRLDDWWH